MVGGEGGGDGGGGALGEGGQHHQGVAMVLEGGLGEVAGGLGGHRSVVVGGSACGDLVGGRGAVGSERPMGVGVGRAERGGLLLAAMPRIYGWAQTA